MPCEHASAVLRWGALQNEVTLHKYVQKEEERKIVRALEQQGQSSEALEIYRKLAQLDFGYKDVRQRVDKLRSQ